MSNLPHTDMKYIRLNCLLNIMDRELYEFSETLDENTVPQRIDDFRALVASMKEIVCDILEPTEVKPGNDYHHLSIDQGQLIGKQ